MQASLLEHTTPATPAVTADLVDLDGVQLAVVDETSENSDGLVVAGRDGREVASWLLHGRHLDPFVSVEVVQLHTGKASEIGVTPDSEYSMW